MNFIFLSIVRKYMAVQSEESKELEFLKEDREGAVLWRLVHALAEDGVDGKQENVQAVRS